MSSRVVEGRSHRGLRASLVSVAAVLGVAAICLIVFGSSQKQLQLGIILGLWAALIAAFEVPAFRRTNPESATQVDLGEVHLQIERLHDAQLAANQESIGAQATELRRLGELHMAREAAARREADVNLQLSIRHEIERTIETQFGVLKDEVSSLRAEVFEKLGGQIKLERIETTRVIGSDLEALQNQIRRLAEDRDVRSVNGRWPDDIRAPEPKVSSAADSAPEKPALEKPALEKPALEKPALEKPALEKPALETPALEKAVPEKATAEKADFDLKAGPNSATLASATTASIPIAVPEPPAVPESAAVAEPVVSDPAAGGELAATSAIPSLAAVAGHAGKGQPRQGPNEAWSPALSVPGSEGAKRPDPFASLPRLTPVPAELLIPLESTPPRASANPQARGSAVPDSTVPDSAVPDSAVPGAAASRAATHTLATEEAVAAGRRRAREEDPNSPHYVGRRRPSAQPGGTVVDGSVARDNAEFAGVHEASAHDEPAEAARNHVDPNGTEGHQSGGHQTGGHQSGGHQSGGHQTSEAETDVPKVGSRNVSGRRRAPGHASE